MRRALTLVASRRFGAGSLAALMLLACVQGCGPAGGRPTRATAASSTPPTEHALVRVQRDQRRAFALLRTPPEPPPASFRRYARPPVPGASLRLAQRLPVVLPGAYWLVPADGYLCIVSERATDRAALNVCTSTARALRHGIALTTVSSSAGASSRLIVGVAPDGAAQVSIHTGHHTSTASVEQSIFVARDMLAEPVSHIDVR